MIKTKKRSKKINLPKEKSPTLTTGKHFKQHCVLKKTASKWKLMSLSTQKYLEYIIKDVGIHLLNEKCEFSDENLKRNAYSAIRNLQLRTMKKLTETIAPNSTNDYNCIDKKIMIAGDYLTSLSAKYDSLNKSISNETKKLKQLEKRME